MKKLPQISEAEYEVMKVIWEAAPVSTNEVTDKLVQSTDWSPKTIQTLLKRLVQKGAVSYRKESRVFVYTPLVKQTEYLEHENSHFLQRFYNGNFASMLTSYLDNDSFTEKELDELRELLKQREGGSR
ncbi:BlaI family transcriptional regulator, penicillinase repressor [Anaerocolumna jejuensis DSM 15929]|uniref:BlaI family transcriptional regulator, penicillinase repressor n=1 Tax=Anaerocolumna jejuensis DSM 15929 TaxID=1121322 RepID=A0A1M6QSN4_9FIRM|nr:BlaI/MecI/CopY family transcriptional regulator [Anaerocolumna jejuensis]SHK23261.1 BlaI family transcriptional regulator, penicillinase repressor [Anaerocolumna jejuensis DSM 15929]